MTALPRRPPSNSPARVVFLLEELNFGGTQRQTLELARRLDPGKYRSEIWLLCAGEDLVPLARKWQIPLVRLSRTSKVTPQTLFNLWHRLRQAKIDLFMTLTALPNIWGRVVGKCARTTCTIGNVRGNTPQTQHERWLWPLATHLICNNKKLESLLLGDYHIPSDRLTMIYNGVDTDYFQPPSAENTSVDATIVSIGRLVPEKAQETLIAAFRLLLQDLPDAQLWLVGDGPLRHDLEQLLQKLPPHRAILVPGRGDIRPFLQQADIFALSSVTEALPNVVLEAMAAGLPVVATDVGGLPELVLPGKTGWLVPHGEPALLAEAMRQLLTDADRRRTFGQAGRKRVERNFSFNRMVQQHEAVFDACLARGGKS